MPRLLAALLAAFWVFAPPLAMSCGLSAQAPLNPLVSLASYIPSDAPEGGAGVGVTFLGHASFLIETPAHVTIVTDYNGYNIPSEPPTIATMNHAHSTHYTLNPDPRIKYVLHGWKEGDAPPQFDLDVGDVRVRNLPTNIREWGGGGTEYYGNSVFVFETNGLCIAHLSHLHHLFTDDDLGVLGPLDVVMMPVDGVWTMTHEDMAHVMEQLHAPLYIPFHYYGDTGQHGPLARFLQVVGDRYTVRRAETASITLSRETLPVAPEILIMQGPPG